MAEYKKPWREGAGKTMTAEYLRQILHYDPATGLWTWIKARPKIHVGDRAGCPSDTGYLCIKIDGKLYKAHRLAFLFMTGEFPPNNSDHRDVDPGNCRWENLRPASRSQNSANSSKPNNNKSGHKGVHWHKQHRKWCASIGVSGKRHHLGLFHEDKIEQAAQAYRDAAQKFFGEFARVG